MEYSYYHDSSSNYMVLTCPKDADNYQYRMLAVNTIPGLLPCSRRFLDGEGYFYYDITSRQSIRDLYENRRMDGRTVQKILYAIVRTQDSIAGYLLDAGKLLPDARFIYYDFEQDEYYFIYFPETVPEYPQSALFEYLAQKLQGTETAGTDDAQQAAADGDTDAESCGMSEEDQKMLLVLYRLCDMAGNPNFVLSEKFLDGQLIDESMETSSGGEMQAVSDSAESSPGPATERALQGNDSAADTEEEMGKEMESIPQEENKKTAGSRKLRKIISLSVICLAAAAGILCMRMAGVFPQEMAQSAWFLSMILFAGALILALYGCVLLIFKSRNDKKDRTMALEKAGREAMRPAFEYDAASVGSRDGGRKEPSSDPGSDLPEAAVFGEGKLYGEGNNRNLRIDLRTLPCTVGRASKFCDVILQDASVARVHARFYRDKDNELQVMDLNSSGGTYLNGIRLMPNESMEIQPGDEIRIGRLEFCYR